MAYDLEEQDRIDALKAFWQRYGNFILTTLTVVLFAVAAYRGWQWWQQREAYQAAQAYETLRTAVAQKNVEQIKANAGTLFESHPKSAQAQMAALLTAKAHQENGDLRAAKAPLQWAAEKAVDLEFRHLARLRLASVLIEEKSFDEALRVLAVDDPGRFAAMYANRRGDALLLQDKADEARAAYRQALERMEGGDALRAEVQLKLDALGGA